MIRHRAISLVMLFAAAPLFAQQPPSNIEDRVKQLEQRLDTLNQQMTAIRQELDALKVAGAPPRRRPADAEDLTKVEVAQHLPAPRRHTAAPPSIGDVTTINNASDPGASKVFNPDTSVIGNFLGKAGQPNPYEFGPDDIRRPMNLDEAEVAFEAFIDPYAKGKFFFSVTKEGIDVEEGYAQFVTLPFDLTAKAGKFKALFGKDNTWHAHVRPWVDQPLVIHNFFGDEGFNDDGISVSKAIANPWNTYIEATGEVFEGGVANVFERRGLNDLVYNAHLKAFRDISENNNIEVGTSYARGTLRRRAQPVRRRRRDVSLEAAATRPVQLVHRPVRGDRQSPRRRRSTRCAASTPRPTISSAAACSPACASIRPDRFAGGADAARRGVSATLTFWPSEFSQLRGQLRRMRYGDVGKSVTELLLQLQFSIGAHGAHTF